jgi:predicted TIM-barrel fold metal-dependent hydrolase
MQGRPILSAAPTVSQVVKWTPQGAIDEMDEGNVDMALLSRPLQGDMPTDKTSAIHWARFFNEYVAGLVESHPGRFGLLASLPLPYIEPALEELTYAFDELGAVGAAFSTSYGNMWLGNAAFDPVLAELDRRSAFVHVHPTVPPACADLIAEVSSATLEYWFDTARAITSLIFTGAVVRFPNIRFVFCHSGGVMPSLFPRMERIGESNPAVKARLPRGIRAEMKRLYFDCGSAGGRHALGNLLNFADPSHVMFGSDFPYIRINDTRAQLANSGLDSGIIGSIDGNAALLLGTAR